MDGTTVTLHLEVHVDDDTLEGRLVSSAGDAREFTGWVGLLGAIDAVLRGTER